MLGSPSASSVVCWGVSTVALLCLRLCPIAMPVAASLCLCPHLCPPYLCLQISTIARPRLYPQLSIQTPTSVSLHPCARPRLCPVSACVNWRPPFTVPMDAWKLTATSSSPKVTCTHLACDISAHWYCSGRQGFLSLTCSFLAGSVQRHRHERAAVTAWGESRGP